MATSVTQLTGYAATNLHVAQQNVLSGVQQQIANLNQAALQDYSVVWQNFVQQVEAGQNPGTNPPQPPLTYVVGYFTDPTNSTILWAYPTLGTTPLTSQPPVPQAPQNAVKLPPYTGEPIVGSKINVPVGDTTPIGTTITDSGGGVWEKFASNTPFGTAQWYERIS